MGILPPDSSIRFKEIAKNLINLYGSHLIGAIAYTCSYREARKYDFFLVKISEREESLWRYFSPQLH